MSTCYWYVRYKNWWKSYLVRAVDDAGFSVYTADSPGYYGGLVPMVWRSCAGERFAPGLVPDSLMWVSSIYMMLSSQARIYLMCLLVQTTKNVDDFPLNGINCHTQWHMTETLVCTILNLLLFLFLFFPYETKKMFISVLEIPAIFLSLTTLHCVCQPINSSLISPKCFSFKDSQMLMKHIYIYPKKMFARRSKKW